jgi:hypothetical protein
MRELSSIEKRDEAERRLKAEMAEVEEARKRKRIALDNFDADCARAGYGSQPQVEMPTNIHAIENDNDNNEHGVDENLLPENLREARRAIVARHDAGLRELYANAWNWQEKVIRLNEGIEREIQPDFDRDKEPFRRFLLEGFELSQFAPKGEKNVEEYCLNLHRFQKAVIDWTLQGVNKSLTDIRIPIVTSDTSGGNSEQAVKRLVVDRRKRMVFGEQIDKEYLRLSKEETRTLLGIQKSEKRLLVYDDFHVEDFQSTWTTIN